MSAKTQHNSIILAAAAFAVAVALVGLIGYLTLGGDEEVIQGQVDVSEYRVSSKVPGRILEIRVKEGDYVRPGDTLAIIDAPDIRAKLEQAKGAEGAADAMSDMAKRGARQEQIRAAQSVLQQAKAGLELAEKSYNRVQRLFEEGVLSEQKRDDTYASYRVMQAQVRAAQSQYDMAVNGAREEEKRASAAQADRAKGAVAEVNSYISETVQVAQCEGEVSGVYPKVGELVGTGTPIISVSILSDLWGTFNIREDQLQGLTVGSRLTAYVPAFDKEIAMKVYYVKDQGSYATWKAAKANGQIDLKTFEVKARPIDTLEGLRPGMSLVLKK